MITCLSHNGCLNSLIIIEMKVSRYAHTFWKKERKRSKYIPNQTWRFMWIVFLVSNIFLYFIFSSLECEKL